MDFLRGISASVIFLLLFNSAESQYLKRSLDQSVDHSSVLASSTARYRTILGDGEQDSEIIKGLSGYGNLLVDPGGKTKTAKYRDEELVLFVLEGTGMFNYEKKEIPVSSNDFIYIPQGTGFDFLNPRETTLSVLVMRFPLNEDNCSNSDEPVMANTEEVKFQTLPSHGPTTTFQLLLGAADSKRDRLAAACKVTSLFIMDFASGGTNNPHRHNDEEEVYLVLRGSGDIVAGENDDKTELRHPANSGDIYFYSPKTLIGFYSGNKPEEEHARILAVRFRYPF